VRALVAGEEDRRADRLLAAQLRGETLDALRVERVERLVEQQHLGPLHERLRQRQLLLHPERVAADAGAGIGIQPHRAHGVPYLVHGDAVPDRGELGEVLQARPVGEVGGPVDDRAEAVGEGAPG
jgi:hypothetical protein